MYQVDLLSADFKPGAVEPEFRALAAYRQIENPGVKTDRTVYVRSQNADVMNTLDHEKIGPTWLALSPV